MKVTCAPCRADDHKPKIHYVACYACGQWQRFEQAADAKVARGGFFLCNDRAEHEKWRTRMETPETPIREFSDMGLPEHPKPWLQKAT